MEGISPMAQGTNSYFRNKKATVSVILSLFVFFIHFCSFSVFLQADVMLRRVFDTLLPVARVAVPLFFMISAAMFSAITPYATRLKS